MGSAYLGHQQLATQFKFLGSPYEPIWQTSIHIWLVLSEKVSFGITGHTGTHYLVRLEANVPKGQKFVHSLFS